MSRWKLPFICLPAALMLGACSAQKSEEAVAAADAIQGPRLPDGVSPGVAFAFDYDFILPGDAISKVQEQHAAACQRLGISRCRVTGMRYDQPSEDNVSAQLDLLLAPDAAHAFGNEATDVVRNAGGELDRASARGENAGEQIRLSQTESAGVTAEIARIQARLAAKGLAASERTELQSQLSDLRQRLLGQAAERDAKEAAIASTPVTLTYASQGIIGSKGAFGKASVASLSSLESAAALLLFLGGLALPWLLVGLALITAWRAARKRLAAGRQQAVQP